MKKLSKYGIIFAIVIFSFSLFRNITKMQQAESKVNSAKKNLEKLKAEQDEIEREIERVTSEEFVEKQIRDKLGLAKEGEIVLVLPDEDTLRKYSPRKKLEETHSLPDPNWKKWAKLFNVEI